MIDSLCLRRDSERVVLPMKRDVSPDESIVTVGECLPSSGYQGETLLACVRWRRPNRLFV